MRISRSTAIDKIKNPVHKKENDQIYSNVLLPEEVNAIHGILTLSKKTVKDIMIPIDKVIRIYYISFITKLTLIIVIVIVIIIIIIIIIK